MSDPAVLAVVLTYHAPESLARCIDAIAEQSRPPDGLLVVDNADPLLPAADPELPKGLPSRILRTGENLGPAGGHARGLAEFMADPTWTHAWVMDDDCVPDLAALAALVDHARPMPEASLVFPTWFNTVSDRVQNAPAWCGFLLSRQAVARAGLPREDLFWWMEDTEYLKFRMRHSGVSVSRTAEAIVQHKPVRRKGPRPPWRIYYEVRNATWFRLRVQRTPDAYRRWLRTVLKVFFAALRTAPRHHRVLALLRGLSDGIRGKLGRTVLPPLPEPRDVHRDVAPTPDPTDPSLD